MGMSTVTLYVTSSLKTRAASDAPSDCLTLRICKLEPPIGDIHPLGASEVPTMGMSTVTTYAHFVHEATSSVGCGLGLPRIVYSQIGPRIGDIHPGGFPRFPR